jgi:FkbM family methyltransferase
MGQLRDILGSSRRWHELPAWARRRWRSRDAILPGLVVAARGNHVVLDGCEFDVASTSLRIRSRFATGRYEAAERRLARDLLDPALPVIELGACIGVVACIVNKSLAHPRRHVVVEANSALLATIERSRELNGATFVVEHAALGYDGPEVELYVHPQLVTASSAQRSRGRAVRVRATTLRALSERHGFERFQLICDVEGAELAMIERDLELLRERVTLAIIEFHPDVYGPEGRQLLVARLESAGFRQVAVDDTVIAFRRLR